jgi:Zn-dependent protease with chaperone function
MLAAVLSLQSFIAAQNSSSPAAQPPLVETQSASPSGAQVSPAAHPDATPIEIPTATQIEAAGQQAASYTPDANAGSSATNPNSPTPKPAAAATTAANGTATQGATLAPKYNVGLIGQRNTGSGLDFYSLDREVALGRQLAQEVESSARVVTDPVITEYVNRIGQNLVRNSDARVPFTIKVLDTEEVNAFALPGGFFYVNSGLILAADNEAELAGVMAHEIAHVAARHATKNMTRAQIWNMASVPLIFIGGPVAYAISEVAGLAIPLGFLKFSRDAEREADLLGLEYDYATGYDPQAFVEFFEKLNIEKKKPNLVAKAFATHPMNVERIQAAQDEIRKYLPDRPEYIVDTSEFENVKERLASLENGHHIGGAKAQPGRPVLLKRTPLGSSSDPGDSGQGSDSQDPGRPTLKRAPGSTDSASTGSDSSTQPRDDDAPILRRAPSSTDSGSAGSGSSTQATQNPQDDSAPTLKRAPGSTDTSSTGSGSSTQDQKDDGPPTLKQAQATPDFQN